MRFSIEPFWSWRKGVAWQIGEEAKPEPMKFVSDFGNYPAHMDAIPSNPGEALSDQGEAM